jgi:hypothetical protein
VHAAWLANEEGRVIEFAGRRWSVSAKLLTALVRASPVAQERFIAALRADIASASSPAM